jgi:mono/diheme cytochrome c family protein
MVPYFDSNPRRFIRIQHDIILKPTYNRHGLSKQEAGMMWAVVALSLLPGAIWAASQVERGEALFFEAGKGCATCHALKGRGTAVGPDLKAIARLSPRGIAESARSTLTQYVQIVSVKGGESFPGMPGAKDDTTIQVYDLSKTPPELKKLPLADVTMRNNDVWKHPSVIAGHTDEQLADIIAYIRYAGAGIKGAVDPADIK